MRTALRAAIVVAAYGLRFAPGAWTLEPRPDAAGGQRARLASLFTP